jgi:hypothetical protein
VLLLRRRKCVEAFDPNEVVAAVAPELHELPTVLCGVAPELATMVVTGAGHGDLLDAVVRPKKTSHRCSRWFIGASLPLDHILRSIWKF